MLSDIFYQVEIFIFEKNIILRFILLWSIFPIEIDNLLEVLFVN